MMKYYYLDYSYTEEIWKIKTVEDPSVTGDIVTVKKESNPLYVQRLKLGVTIFDSIEQVGKKLKEIVAEEIADYLADIKRNISANLSLIDKIEKLQSTLENGKKE